MITSRNDLRNKDETELLCFPSETESEDEKNSDNSKTSENFARNLCDTEEKKKLQEKMINLRNQNYEDQLEEILDNVQHT